MPTLRSHSSSNISRLALVTLTRPILSRLKISPLSSAVDVIEIVYDIYAIPNSGPPRDAYDRFCAQCEEHAERLLPEVSLIKTRMPKGELVGAHPEINPLEDPLY